jgi:hypothetical protein
MKTVQINDKKEILEVQFDSIGWAKELKPIRDLDLNKPRFIGAYRVKRSDEEQEYVAMAGQRLLVRRLKVKRINGTLSSIEGVILDDQASSIYETYQKITVSFSDNLLQKYTVEGYQKMVMMDTTYYKIEANRLN